MTAASFSFSRQIYHPRRAPRREVEDPPYKERRNVHRQYVASYVDPGSKRQVHFRGGGVWPFSYRRSFR